MSPHIKVYTSDDCSECEGLLTFLDDAGIQYGLKNISKNSEYLKELQKVDIYLTPAVIINDHHRFIGFQKNKIAQALGI